jgi:NAD(P)H-dependent FMN reductase
MPKTKLMILVASVRPGRIGLPIATWVLQQTEECGLFEIDFADLAEINLPMMDEPNHPRLRQYTKPHTHAWSARVDAADAFLFVTPEYNHGYAPSLKNAVDFLGQEWWRKPVGYVSYGGVSGGSRAVAAFDPVANNMGLVKTGANVELPFAAANIAGGVYTPGEKEIAILGKLLEELTELAGVLKTAR